MPIARSKFFQAAWIVNDLEKAIERWIETANVGPFYVIPHCAVEDYVYRGTPGTIDFSGALAQSGPIQIELIQQHNDGPSAYRDTFAPGEEGFHHMCTFVDDFDAEIERLRGQNAALAHGGKFGDMRFAYLDTREAVGCMTEIIEDRATIREIFKMVSDAAVNWDGKDPIRTL